MRPTITNVDILDDKEPPVLVQLVAYSDRTFQVFRKPTSPDEVFTVSPGVEIDRNLYWIVAGTLFETAADLGEDLLELFALVYRAEENPPTYDNTHLSNAEECIAIAFDPEAGCYRCEGCLAEYEEIDGISAPTLDEAIALGVDRLHEILSRATS